jgi:hypothetical protein
MVKMIESFENEVKIRTKGTVKIERKIHSGTVISNIKSDDDLDALDIGTSDGPPQQVWIERMEDFRSALISIHRLLNNRINIPRIKACINCDIDFPIPSLGICAPITYVQNITTYILPVGCVDRRWCRSFKFGYV